MSKPRVIVVAASIEGIDALARLINQLPSTFPLPVIVNIHRLQGQVITRLKNQKWHSASNLDVVYAQEGNPLLPGRVYVIPAGESMGFTAVGMLDLTTNTAASNADHLFESAAHWYQSGVIGVVLSGLGTDGTHGLRVITKVDGTRVVQSPSEATFSSMPSNAMLGDHVQHSVMLDQLGHLLMALVGDSEGVEKASSPKHSDVARRVLSSGEQQAKALDHSIVSILGVMREQLFMDIVLVTKKSGDHVVVSHAAASSNDGSIQGISMPTNQTLCQRVLDGHLPAVMPDVESMRLTHDIPETPIFVGAYMAAPVWLENGELYGTLCCLSSNAAPKLDQIHYRRLQMTARQIARLINEAGIT
ncbi:chemotaxis protein CheB [Variovorax sp. PvP013]|uniref:chemotaxis protein CheB n=1 Tax=Variovorax sp. PvP013 TaxID=3156435 RepID=UPI003D2385C8